MDRDAQRAELGDFLRRRRGELVRADFDLPPVARSRATGLRREEIAYRAGVSVTWYTWLEQGRPTNPSRQVLDALAATMRLTAAEHGYLLGLAGFAAAPLPAAPRPRSMPSHLQQLVDVLVPSPAFVVTADWSFSGWNRAYEALYPHVATLPADRRNLLWAIFTDPYVRDLLPDWENSSRQFVAEFRAESGAALTQPEQLALVERLRAASPDFARAWDQHRVERFASRERRFRHPVAGELVFDQHRLIPADEPELHIVVYLAVGTTPERLSELLATG